MKKLDLSEHEMILLMDMCMTAQERALKDDDLDMEQKMLIMSDMLGILHKLFSNDAMTTRITDFQEDNK
jgi:hypothetical protein